MWKSTSLIGSLAALGVGWGVLAGDAFAQSPHNAHTSAPTAQTGEFQRIEQPLWVKGVVTAGGFGLIGLELWWFLFSKPKSRRAATQAGIQEITITVDGGYEPSQIVVQVGQPVRLKFDRQDPSGCLEEVRLPDFHIAQALSLNQITTIEFTPEKPGRYEFTCGMNMFRGVIEAQARTQSSPITTSSSVPHSLESLN